MVLKHERPIDFAVSMIVALQNGTKTQTRRKAPKPGVEDGWGSVQPGSTLWVREGLEVTRDGAVLYAAGGVPVPVATEHAKWARSFPEPYCRSNLMPRWATRFTLRVLETRLERVAKISMADAVAEGAQQRADGKWTLDPSDTWSATAVEAFQRFYQQCYGIPACQGWCYAFRFELVTG